MLVHQRVNIGKIASKIVHVGSPNGAPIPALFGSEDYKRRREVELKHGRVGEPGKADGHDGAWRSGEELGHVGT